MENYEKLIRDLLSQITILYLIYCIPVIELNKENGEVIFTYKWTSFEMEQNYYDLLSKLSFYNLKIKELSERN